MNVIHIIIRYRDSRSRSRSPRYKDRDSRDNRDRNYGRFGKPRSTVFIPGLDGALWTYRQFMEAQPYKIDPEKAEKIYHKYKKEYDEKQNTIFFTEHKVNLIFINSIRKYHFTLLIRMMNGLKKNIIQFYQKNLEKNEDQNQD